MLDGWRYGFIQGLNKAEHLYLQRPLDLTLYTIEADKRRRYVANLYAAEVLSGEQAEDARNLFRANGWLDIMRKEVEAIGGNVAGLGDPKAAPHILNVRYRIENFDPFAAGSYAAKDDTWLNNRHRYKLYDVRTDDEERIETALRGRSGTKVVPETRLIFRRGSRPVEYDPLHRKMQARLFADLQERFGAERVVLERDFVDVRVQTEKEIILYEIKTDLEPRSVIRQALGQILEYAYYPPRSYELPVRLVIVGRMPLGTADEEYLACLKEKCELQVEYECVSI